MTNEKGIEERKGMEGRWKMSEEKWNGFEKFKIEEKNLKRNAQ